MRRGNCESKRLQLKDFSCYWHEYPEIVFFYKAVNCVDSEFLPVAKQPARPTNIKKCRTVTSQGGGVA